MAGKPRAKVRLRLDRGTALVRELGIGSVLCDVMDVSEGGCSCRLIFSKIGDESVDAWKTVIIPGRVLTLDLSESLNIPDLVIPECQIRWVQSLRATEVVFGVSFSGLDDGQMQALGRSIMILASHKLRTRKAAPESSEDAPAEPKEHQEHKEPEPTPAPPPETPRRSTSARIRALREANARGGSHGGTHSHPMPHAPSHEDPRSSATSSGMMLKAHDRGHEPHWGTPEDASVPRPASKGGLWKEAASLERQKRIAADFPIVYEFIHPQREHKLSRDPVEGVVVDFNEGGFQLEGPGPDFCEAAEICERAKMLGTLRVGVNELAVKLQIVSVKQSSRTNALFMYGVRILDMPETDRALLRELYIRASLTTINIRKRH